MKNGFDLIVRSMGTGQIASPHVLGGPCEKPVSAAAGRILKSLGKGLDFPGLPPLPLARESEACRELADENFIAIRLFPSEAVVIVSDDQLSGAPMFEGGEPAKEGDTVGAS